MIVSIDLRDELLEKTEAAAKGEGLSFREYVAMALEKAVATAKPSQLKPFVQRVHDFGSHLESPWTLLAEIEAEAVIAELKK